MAKETAQSQPDRVDPPNETVWLDMATGEIVREFGDTTARYRPGEAEFALYAEMNTYEKRNGRKPSA